MLISHKEFIEKKIKEWGYTPESNAFKAYINYMDTIPFKNKTLNKIIVDVKAAQQEIFESGYEPDFAYEATYTLLGIVVDSYYSNIGNLNPTVLENAIFDRFSRVLGVAA